MPRIVRTLAAVFCLGSVSLLPSQTERLPETFQLALGLQQRGMHDEAARHFEDFIAGNPGHRLLAEAHYRAGVSLAELEKGEAAIRALRTALERGGARFRLRPECRYRLGNLLQADGQHEAAAEQFGRLGQEVDDGHYLLAAAAFAEGECHRERGDDQAAAAAFARSAKAAAASGSEQKGFRFPALYQLGFCLLRSSALAQAAEVFEYAAEAAEDDAARGECLFLRGDALLRLERFDDAERAFRASLERQSEFRDDAQFGLGWVALGRGDQRAARSAFARVVSEHGASPLVDKARLELGRSFYRDEDYDRAQNALAPLDGDGVAADVRREARELVGLCALASGAGERAVATLQRAVAEAEDEDKPRLSFALGEAFANISRWAEAVPAYAAVPPAAGAELYGDALYGQCFALHMLGRHEQSIEKAELLRALEPRHRLYDDATFAIAENLFLMQRHADARGEYDELRDHDSFGGKARWKLAWCSYLAGGKADAARRFSAIAAGESQFAEEALAMEALSRLESGDADGALTTADRYRARYQGGAFLDRTERVAARVLRQRGNLAAARKRLERAAAAVASNDGDASGDRLEQAELAYQQGDYGAADELYAGLARREDAAGARALAGRAWCAFELGDDDDCALYLTAGLAHGSGAAERAGLLELQSALCHRKKDWQSAIAVARTFLDEFGDHEKAPALRYALGVAQARSQDFAAARATLAALERAGGYERMDRVIYELAWACRKDGAEADALAAFARLTGSTQDEEMAGEARLHLGSAALDRDDLAAARELLLAVAGSHRGRALYRLGFAEFEAAAGADEGRLLAAARDRMDAVAAIPDEPLAGEALYLGAECCQRLGDSRGAVERAGRLLARDEQHDRADRARLVLGECAVELGDGDTAVPVLEAFLRVPDRERAAAARAWLALGRARFLRGEHDRAEQSFAKTTELSEGPLAAEAQFRIGESRAKAGDLRGAADAFVKLPILYSHEEWVRRGLLQAGIVYQQLRQPDKARRFFEELLSKYPDSAEASAARDRLRDD